MALEQERRKYPELGEIDGIDDNFEDGAAEDPDQMDKQNKKQETLEQARSKITDALFKDDESEDEKKEVNKPKEEVIEVQDAPQPAPVPSNNAVQQPV